MTAEQMAGALIGALEHAWSDIRHKHPDVPPAVLVTGCGSRPESTWLRPGRSAASCWQTTTDGVRLDEIFVSGEGLERSARSVLATLLHEAAHAVARARAIKETSRQGRYHNARFKSLAEELGLTAHKHPTDGWTRTALPDTTVERYAMSLTALEQALTTHRRHERTMAGHSRGRSNVLCVCVCGRRIRVARSVLARGEILCGVCAQPFGIAG